jgi:hypothetical protein
MIRYEELLVNKNTILLLLKCDDIAKIIVQPVTLSLRNRLCGKHFALAGCK